MKKLQLIAIILFLTSNAFAQIPNYIPTNNLVAWYPFNGNANDESSNGNTLTNNGPTLTSDRYGNTGSAYSFNGNTGQYFTGSNNTLPMGKSRRTISMWIHPYSIINTSVTATAFSYGSSSTSHGIMLGLISSNTIAFQGWADDANATYNYSFNQWINIIATYDSVNAKIYVNGNLIGTTTKSNWNTTGTEFMIGARFNPSTGSGHFNGKIDDIAVWNRVLTATEIQKVYLGCNLSIVSEPSNLLSSFGSNVKFMVKSSDTSCAYQWQTNNGLGFQNLTNAGQYSGANRDTLNISNLTFTNSNQKFRCIISSGTCRDTSVVALLNMTNNFVIPIQIPANGLVAWYPFNGDVTDESGNGNEATSNTAALSSDRYGNLNSAYTFDGNNNQKMLCLNKTLPMGKSKRTISLWMNPTSIINIAQTSTAFSYGNPSTSNAIMLGLSNAGIVPFQGWADDLSANYAYSFNQWINVVATFDSLNAKLYVNGNLIGSSQKPNWNTGGTDFIIGGRIGPTSITFDGKIDDIAVWNRVLTAAEIQKLYMLCPTFVSQPASQNSSFGNNVKFIVKSSDPGCNYQWQSNNGLGFQNLSNSSQYAGVNDDTLSISALTWINSNQKFRCIISLASCKDTSSTALLTMTNTFVIPPQIPANGLVAWYPFNGNAIDESGNGNEATSNIATLSTDKFGNPNKAYLFNGNNGEKITCLNKTLPMGKSNRSISMWLDPYSIINIAQTSTALSYGNPTMGNAIMLGLINNGVVACQGWSDDLNANYSYTFNQWINVIATFDSINVKLYINGTLAGSAQKANWNTTGTGFIIGGRIGSTAITFDGKIDDIAVWNRVLTAAEISTVSNYCFLSVNSEPVNDTDFVGNSVQFYVTASDSSAGFQWQSDLGVGFVNIPNTGQFAGVNNDTLSISGLTLANNNQLFRCIVSKGSCYDTTVVSRLIVNDNIGLSSNHEDHRFSLYPNPTNSVLFFSFKSKMGNFNYSIFDQTGRIVREGKLAPDNVSVSVEDLASGIYFLRLNETSFHVTKFIKN